MISVIVPLYNKEKCIKRTIDSVLQQSYSDFELVIVNDGSTDNSLQIVRNYEDNRIRIIDKSNEGVSKTRNRGAQEAAGTLLYFLDADDYMYPKCLEVLMNACEKYPEADIWTGDFESECNSQKHKELNCPQCGYLDDAPHLLWNMKWRFRMGSFLMTKKSFLDFGGLPTYIDIGEDIWFTLNYIQKYRCVYVDEVVMSYVQDNRSLSKRNIDMKQCCVWYADFNSGNRFISRRFAGIVGTSMTKSLLHLDFSSFITLCRKYRGHVAYILFWGLVFQYKKKTR